MSTGAPTNRTSLGTDPVGTALSRALATAHGVLPDQGPIGVFVHHNTLHAFQHLPFHEGVQAGAAALGAEPYLSVAAFRAAVQRGRITLDDVRLEIARSLGDLAEQAVCPGVSQRLLREAQLLHVPPAGDTAAFRYLLSTGAAAPLATPALWAACVAQASVVPRPLGAPRPWRRHRDALVARGAPDPDLVVHAELVRLASGFLDQGQARVVAPHRDAGFLSAVATLYAAGGRAPRGCPGVVAVCRRIVAEHLSAEAVIREALDGLGVDADATEDFVVATLLALPGWAGMFARLERHPVEHEGTPVSLADFLAVRLCLDHQAVVHGSHATGLPVAWPALSQLAPPAAAGPSDPLADALALWHIAQVAQLSADTVRALTATGLQGLWAAMADFPDWSQRQLFQEAYERSYRTVILDALAARRALPVDPPSGERPRAQFVFCIDEREESIRRALEEQHPGYLTFGTAGFFGVAIDYQGLDDHAPAAHCPVVVTPAHEVHEQPVYTARDQHALRQRTRGRWLALERQAATASRTLTGGAGLSFLLGPLSGLKTLARVAAPRSSRRLGAELASRLTPPPATRLSTLRLADAGQAIDRGKPVGFSLDESVDRVTAVLTNLGLVTDFAPVIVVLGHGSTSLNNPHESAHDCGACGGRRGGANARLFADMANRPDVREGVRRRGIAIPDDCWFVGALHDTANDAVQYYDMAALPPALVPAFEEAFTALETARRLSAQERCRRFDDVPLDIAPDAALQHVEARASHLAQPRPEYGHCTNAIAVVGRRTLTRGLHLDRRPFLVSYDPTIDTDHRILERILAAVGPVGAGISLEYYFSSVDNERFGCGTKLPHNVTGLIGIMNGHQGDLRTGLPLQMVELHEPMRLLLVVEATPDALLAVAGRQAEVAELVTREWIQLVSVDPVTGAMQRFADGAFHPYDPHPVLLPVVERSHEWHRQGRAHLLPALVRCALPAAAVGPGHHAGRVA